MKMPVKVISQQSRFLAHLNKGPCKLFSSLDLRSPESKVHMRKCHHYDDVRYMYKHFFLVLSIHVYTKSNRLMLVCVFV
jgi:hypothetical protein